jgi:Ca2+:H+ antiporter
MVNVTQSLSFVLNQVSATDEFAESDSYISNNDFHTQDGNNDDEDDEVPEISFNTAILVLFVVTVLVTILSEFMVGAVQGAASDWQLSNLYLGGIVIPLVGNAAGE